MGSNMVYDVVKSVSCILEIYFVVSFYNEYGRIKKEKLSQGYYFACITATIASMFVNLFGNTLLNITVNSAIYLILGLILRNKNIWETVKEWLLVLWIMIGVEFVFAMLQSVCVRASAVVADEIFKDEFTAVSSIFSVELTKFAAFSFVKQCFPKTFCQRIDKKLFFIYAVQAAVSITIMVLIPYIRPLSENLTFTDIIIVVLYIIILFENMCLLYFLEKYDREREGQFQKEFELARYYEMQKHFDEIERINKSHEVYIHDMGNYLKQVAIYADKGNNRDILNVMEKLSIQFFKNDNKVYCNSILMNAILVDLEGRAKLHDISTEIFVEQGFSFENMADMDIMVLLGNAFDNAYEAAQKCRQGYIQVKMFKQNEGAFSIVRVINTYEGEILVEGDILLTTKDNKRVHGIGRQNMRDVVSRYGGIYTNSYDGKMYRLVISIPN